MRQKGNLEPLKKRTSRRVIKTAVVLVMILCLIAFLNWMTEDEGAWKPDYPKIDLGAVVTKEALTKEDYHTVFMQTGLGRSAADRILSEKSGELRKKAFQQFQDDFFAAGEYECRIIAVIVHEEKMRDEEGNPIPGFQVPDLRNGDILITKATHSLGWRHGHASIVTDAGKGETLEAILLGNPSVLQNIDKWRTFPSFIHLRLKTKDPTVPEQAAEYAKKEILGVPYSLFTGMLDKAPDEIKKTQCSHLVWYPYERLGYDLDSDGSWLVTPKDIANSKLLEVVQVYGVDPEEIWE